MTTLLDDEVISTKCFHPRKPFPADTTKKRSKTILYFHGNGEIVADYVESKFKQGLEEAGFNIFFVEYRGYGHSDGRVGYTGFFEDLKFIHDHLIRDLGVLESEIVCFGRSLGGLYATEFALQYPLIKALVLECTFSDPSMLIHKRLANDAELSERFPLDKVKEEARKYINNAEKLKRINPSLPVLILHAADDNLIDKIHAEENFEACASTKKKLVMYPIGQHNFFHAANHEAYEVEGVKYHSIYDEVVDVSNL